MPHSNQTNYEPEVDDYVIWTTELGMVHEGWVYFKVVAQNDPRYPHEV